MVKRLLGLNQLPDASTVSRALSSIDGMSIARVRELCRNLVIERLKKMAIFRITLDFAHFHFRVGPRQLIEFQTDVPHKKVFS